MQIYNMGGGTSDTSLSTIEHLGGEDFDDRIGDFYVQDSKRKKGGKDLAGDHRVIRHLRTQCECANRTS